MENTCFRARIVVLANKFPGYEKFSSYSAIIATTPYALVSKDQYAHMLEELTGGKISELPYKSLNIKLTEEGRKDKETYEQGMLALKSHL